MIPADGLTVALAGDASAFPVPIGEFAADLEKDLNWRLVGAVARDIQAVEVPEDLRASLITTSDIQRLFTLSHPDLIIVAGGVDLLSRIRRQVPEHTGVMDLASVLCLVGNTAIRGERSSLLLDRLPDPVFIVDANGSIQGVNQAFLDLFPDISSKTRQKTCYKVLYAREEPCPVDDCPLRIEDRQAGDIHYRDYSFSDGEASRQFEAAFSSIPNQAGEPNRFLVSMRNVTARKELEIELDRSRSRYLQLFEHAREGIGLFNASGRILESNTSLCRLLGYLSDELLGMEVSNLAQEESREILAHHLHDLQILGSVTVDMTFLGKGGRAIPVEVDIVWLPEERIFLLMVRDMTSRKRLEDSRRLYSEKLEAEVEERTRALRSSQQETVRQKQYVEGVIQGTPVPLLVLDRNHRITFWNKACESLTGFTSEAMIGTDWQWKPFYSEPRPTLADLIIEDDQETIQRLYAPFALRRFHLIDGAWEAEAFFPHLGDEGAHIYFTAAPIRNERDEIQGAIVTYQDVSERVNMTREIERREAFVQNLVHNSIDGIIATNPDGIIVIFNRGAAGILGYDPEEVLGSFSYQDILSRETTRDVLSAFYGERYGPPGKVINMESELLNREGVAIPVRLSGALLHEEGKEVGSVVFVQDLREIQRLQQEKESAERMAAVGKTVAGLAHYIKNVLNGLKGGGYVINSALSRKDIPLIAKGWHMVEKNIEQISNIVLDMLTYSTSRKPRYENVDPKELATEVLDLMEDRARLSNVRLEGVLASNLPPVAMDRTGIHRSLLNLISNAIDACTLEGIMKDNGSVHVRVDRPPGWGVRFTVSDNGTGMDRQTQDRLFSDFFTTKGYKGTGLGLPVTQKIVHEHGGRLNFESDPGRGSTFTILLPDRKGEPV